MPPHVRPEQVYRYDMYSDERLLRDLHTGYHAMQQEAPEIFWTPRNGGHWLVTRFDLIEQVIKDAASFSNRELEIPKTQDPVPGDPDQPRSARAHALSQDADAPLHPAHGIRPRRADAGLGGAADRQGPGRRPLRLRRTARRALPGHRLHGARRPAARPLRRVPADRHRILRRIPAERRIELQRKIFFELETVLRARMDEPRDDLFSRLVAEEVDRRELHDGRAAVDTRSCSSSPDWIRSRMR
ncbi:hypothetical protein AB5I41_08745 [Sphingomonas sp. MMS24-JH45]